MSLEAQADINLRQLQPSPPAPTEEQDLSKASPDSEPHGSSGGGKGKGKQTHDSYVDNESYTPPSIGGGESYPPVNDEEAETRQVEANLRRWETAERQRRKAARESSSGAASSTSLVSDVTRRASLLWPGRKSHQPARSSLGTHTALRSRDSVDVVLEDIEASPSPSPSPSPRAPSPARDPFSHPSDPISPFDDPTQESAVMNASSRPPTPNERKSKRTSTRPILDASSSTSLNPPLPKPLNLPPPLADEFHTAKPPGPTLNPISSSSVAEPEVEKEVKWWHDWLCGCSEGSDRGGDNQAGRTNPFE